MAKYQKPIRYRREELFDSDWSYEKREQVKTAYADFWETLDDITRLELYLFLL